MGRYDCVCTSRQCYLRHTDKQWGTRAPSVETSAVSGVGRVRCRRGSSSGSIRSSRSGRPDRWCSVRQVGAQLFGRGGDHAVEAGGARQCGCGSSARRWRCRAARSEPPRSRRSGRTCSAAAGLAIGAIHLDHLHPLDRQVASQADAVGPGALDPDLDQPAQRGQPGRQRRIARCAGRDSASPSDRRAPSRTRP